MYERAGASVKRACADVRAAGHALEADRGEMSRWIWLFRDALYWLYWKIRVTQCYQDRRTYGDDKRCDQQNDKETVNERADWKVHFGVE